MLEDEARVHEVDRVGADLREEGVGRVLEHAVRAVAIELSRQPDHLGRAVDPIAEVEPAREGPDETAGAATEVEGGLKARRSSFAARKDGCNLARATCKERVEIPPSVPYVVTTADRPEGIE